tara:strand:+ start:1114 stop:1230 length:117 start_codon:yes stop_codon:yes gene_type:complete
MKEVKSFLWEAEAMTFVSGNDDLIVLLEWGKYVVYDVS